jgi:tetratricopeptide (TPR) repeat protein
MRIYSDFIKNKMTSPPGEQERAIALLQRKSPPTNRFRRHLFRPFCALAKSYRRARRLAKAVDAFEKALEVEAGLTDTHGRVVLMMDIARDLHYMGREDEALDRVRQGLDCAQAEAGIPPDEVLSAFPDVERDKYLRAAIRAIVAK